MIKINSEKCVGCFNCMDKCICGAIEKKDGKAYYTGSKGCIKCLHCAIACKEKAITWDDEDAVTEEEVFETSEAFADELKSFLVSKRSYRNFSDREVEMEIIKEALDTASWAPASCNRHYTKYYVMTRETIDKSMDIIKQFLEESGEDREVLEGLKNGVNLVFAKAKTAILAYCRSDFSNAVIDTALALDYATLVLESKGIGSCWAGYLNSYMNKIPELKEMFPIPDGSRFFGCMLIGYPEEKYYHIPNRIRRADIKVV